MRSNLVLLTIALPALALLIAALALPSPNIHFRNLRVNNVQSLNWAGYVATSNFSTPQPIVTFVNASWIVQNVSASSKSTYSSQWTGIGGYFANDSSLIQTGTESDFVGGSAIYDAWWELLPAAETVISNFSVGPGDRMQASVMLVNSASNQWIITLRDISRNEIFTKTVTYASSRLSGEFVEERPAFCSGAFCRLTNLANFGTAYYGSDYTSLPTTSFLTVGTSTNAIANFANQAITMVSSSGTALATPSTLTTDGSSFSVNYGSATTTVTTTSTIPTTSVTTTLSTTTTSIATTSLLTTSTTSTSVSTTSTLNTTSTSTTSIATTTVCTRFNPHGKCV